MHNLLWMSLLRFLKNPGGGESRPWLPTPQSSAEKADNDEVATPLEKRKKKKEEPTQV